MHGRSSKSNGLSPKQRFRHSFQLLFSLHRATSRNAPQARKNMQLFQEVLHGHSHTTAVPSGVPMGIPVGKSKQLLDQVHEGGSQEISNARTASKSRTEHLIAQRCIGEFDEKPSHDVPTSLLPIIAILSSSHFWPNHAPNGATGTRSS